MTTPTSEEDLRAELRDCPCRVGDRSFVQCGTELIDVGVAKISQPNHVRVRFDSRQYFELLARYPKTLPALKAARCVKIAVGNTIYEIYE